MTTRYTRADIDVQAAILAAYSRAAGILAEGDRLAITRHPGMWSLHIVRAGQTSLSAYPSAGAFGKIGDSAREAFHTLNVMQETLSAALDALGIERTYPREEVEAIRGEK